jgi:hypothetical protein
VPAAEPAEARGVPSPSNARPVTLCRTRRLPPSALPPVSTVKQPRRRCLTTGGRHLFLACAIPCREVEPPLLLCVSCRRCRAQWPLARSFGALAEQDPCCAGGLLPDGFGVLSTSGQAPRPAGIRQLADVCGRPTRDDEMAGDPHRAGISAGGPAVVLAGPPDHARLTMPDTEAARFPGAKATATRLRTRQPDASILCGVSEGIRTPDIQDHNSAWHQPNRPGNGVRAGQRPMHSHDHRV